LQIFELLKFLIQEATPQFRPMLFEKMALLAQPVPPLALQPDQERPSNCEMAIRAATWAKVF